MFVTLNKEQDRFIDSYFLKETETQYALVFDGKAEVYTVLWRTDIEDLLDSWFNGQWQMAWRGNWESAFELYKELVVDSILDHAGFEPPTKEPTTAELQDNGIYTML